MAEERLVQAMGTMGCAPGAALKLHHVRLQVRSLIAEFKQLNEALFCDRPWHSNAIRVCVSQAAAPLEG